MVRPVTKKRMSAEQFHEKLVELLKNQAVTAMVTLVAYVNAVGKVKRRLSNAS